MRHVKPVELKALVRSRVTTVGKQQDGAIVLGCSTQLSEPLLSARTVSVRGVPPLNENRRYHAVVNAADATVALYANRAHTVPVSRVPTLLKPRYASVRATITPSLEPLSDVGDGCAAAAQPLVASFAIHFSLSPSSSYLRCASWST